MIGLFNYWRTFMQSFSPYQKKILLENPNVLKITENHLVFVPEFKIQAVEFFLKGMTPDEIFISHGFNPDFFEKDYFRLAIKRWRIKYETHGKDSLIEETRGNLGRPKSTDLDDFTIDDLRALVYIQDEIINEIKKKRALAKK